MTLGDSNYISHPQPPLGAWNFKELLEASSISYFLPQKAESALGGILGIRSL